MSEKGRSEDRPRRAADCSHSIHEHNHHTSHPHPHSNTRHVRGFDHCCHQSLAPSPSPFSREHPNHALHWLGIGLVVTTFFRKQHFNSSPSHPWSRAGSNSNSTLGCGFGFGFGKGLLFFGLGAFVANAFIKRRALTAVWEKRAARGLVIKKENTDKGWKVVVSAERETEPESGLELDGDERKEEARCVECVRAEKEKEHEREEAVCVDCAEERERENSRHQEGPSLWSGYRAPRNEHPSRDQSPVRDPSVHERLDAITDTLEKLSVQVTRLQTAAAASPRDDSPSRESQAEAENERGFTMITA